MLTFSLKGVKCTLSKTWVSVFHGWHGREHIASLADKTALCEYCKWRIIHTGETTRTESQESSTAVTGDVLWPGILRYRLSCSLLLKCQRIGILIAVLTAEFTSLCLSKRLHTILRHILYRLDQIDGTHVKLRGFLHSSHPVGHPPASAPNLSYAQCAYKGSYSAPLKSQDGTVTNCTKLLHQLQLLIYSLVSSNQRTVQGTNSTH